MVSLGGLALNRLRLVDFVILGWIVVASAVAIARWSSAPYPAWVLVAHVLVVLLIALVRRPERSGQASVGDLYPLAILLAFYGLPRPSRGRWRRHDLRSDG